MLYNKQSLSPATRIAGKISVVTALTGFLIFAFIFLLNIGKTELQKVEAQGAGTATTTLTVLNTPPVWVAGLEGREEFESSTTTPTNSFSEVSWIGTAIDSNGAPYFMIVCSTNATPTAMQAASSTALGTAPPTCDGGIEWGVSTSTVSGAEARVSTTTIESAPFGQVNDWYAWVCDDDPVNPRCSITSSQGINATNTSPFYVNPRPVFSWFNNDGPVEPGGTLTFVSTSSDAYTPLDLDIFLIVCSDTSYDVNTNECDAEDFIASTTINMKSNASAQYILDAIVQDTAYNAYGYVYDQFGHSASGGAHGTNVPFTVSNVAPTVAGGSISLNGGQNIILTTPGAETSGFTLDFVVADANSCKTFDDNDEIVGYVASVFRSGVGTTTCDGSSGSYDPNSCYPSGVSASIWNLSCVPAPASCTHTDLTPDDTMVFNCTFPLWFIADPTNGIITDTPFYDQWWVAGVAGIDNNNATGTVATSTSQVELLSLVAIDLQTSLIAYDQLEPGDAMPNLTASTSLRVLGNTGLNQLLGGDSMCGTYSPSSPCPVSATSTIPQDEQRYATSSTAYSSGTPLQASSTPGLLEIEIPKPTSTTTPSLGVTYWGISVPGSITLAGSYTGMNTFTGAVSTPASW